ncbi:hypothetical protein GCM10010218_38930 [Streptomyces mashuensis]|uniref:Uncharacterized protein n=1 Tax=Streptomyces mashuensis TaxID=33904 RepID=A0A919EE51_9ACTN|nr:hypothetical protein [Streptomyces mashuensis]GHF53922.1 hypothetical protein GCM10010218_38930 [Streptomyces mashuensis]
MQELAFFREGAQLPPESRSLLGEEEFLPPLFLIRVVRGGPEGSSLMQRLDDGRSVGGVDAVVGEQAVDAGLGVTLREGPC